MQINIFGVKSIKIFVIFLGLFFTFNTHSIAIDPKMVDTDIDGISDYLEVSTYKTDPNLFDTDGDGINDAQEILKDKTDPLSAESSILKIEEMSLTNVILAENAPTAWYIARISGIAALIMYTLVVSMGLLMTSRILLKIKFLKNPDALKMHSFNATFIAFALVVIHFTSLMFDHYIKLSLTEILIPFIVQRELKSALGFDFNIPIGLGIIAFYISILLILTSHFRRKLPNIKIWRMIHFSSFLFYLLFIGHGILAGSDTKETWMQLIYIWSVVQVTGLILLRIFGKKYFLPVLPKPAVVPDTKISLETKS